MKATKTFGIYLPLKCLSFFILSYIYLWHLALYRKYIFFLPAKLLLFYQVVYSIPYAIAALMDGNN